MRRWPGVLLVLMSVVLVGAACSKSNDSGGSTPTSAGTSAPAEGSTTGPTTAPSGSGEESGGGHVTIDGEQANDHGSADLSGKSEFKLEADDYYFDPTTLKGTAGQTVKLEIKNEGSTEHNFTV